jgi:hypothetical protein
MNARLRIVRRMMSMTGSCGIIGQDLFIGLGCVILSRRQRFGEEGVEQAAADGGGGSEARLQPVAQGHQRIDLGDDAVLFGEGWKGDAKV